MAKTDTLHGLAQKSNVAEGDKRMLGTRAPSPPMSAKRENSHSFKMLEIERAAHATAGEPAFPVLTRSFPDRIDFLGESHSMFTFGLRKPD